MDYNELLENNEKLIWSIASRFYDVPKEDLFQAGAVGLLKAANNYDSSSNTKFSTYAYEYIFGEMYSLVQNKNIKVSKDILNLYKKIESARYEVAQLINRVPTNLELSEYLGLDLFDVEIAIASAQEIMSLDEVNDDNKSEYDYLKAANEDIDNKILLEESLEKLSMDEKNIIMSRYYEDLTQSEVARKLKMSQVKVSRYEKKGIDKMREYISL